MRTGTCLVSSSSARLEAVSYTHLDVYKRQREDYVEEAWRIVDPILDNATPLYPYQPGTWGPAQADALVADDGGWFNPRPPVPVKS